MACQARLLRLIDAASVALAIALASAAVRAQDTPLMQGQFGDVSVEAAVVEPGKLRIDLRAQRPVKFEDITLEWNGRAAPLQQWNAYPTRGAISAVMLLIDSSDQRRQEQIERVASQLLQLQGLAGAHHRFGVATYDSELTIWLPPDATADKLAPALAGLRATGKATELYKSTLTAIKRLAELPVGRRAIFLFSDGLAEDVGYRSEDVITAARAAGVVIYTFDTGADGKQTAATANLILLSKGSGGAHATISDDPADLGRSIGIALAALDSGGVGYFEVPTDGGQTIGTVVVRWNDQGKPGEATLRFQPRTVPVQVAQEPPKAAPEPPRAEWIPWAAATGAILGSALLLFSIWRIRLARRRGLAGEPVAWLDVLTQGRRHVGVDRLPFRIGRNADNALVLPLDTISSYHAEISRNEQGQLEISDMNSKNGLYVNLTKIHGIVLHNGDLIELGEVKIRFRSVS